MTDRPILFSAPMVRALLAGAKTQTRRIVKVQPTDARIGGACTYDEHGTFVWLNGNDGSIVERIGRCPYGAIGDRLWVRETWARNENQLSDSHMDTSLVYRADDKGRALDNGGEKPWTPAIHMPRWASRITLEVTGVRVERLQDISDADAQAEGCSCYVCDRPMDGQSEDDCHCYHRKASAADYRMLWESINGAGSWDANPWCWVIEFKRNP